MNDKVREAAGAYATGTMTCSQAVMSAYAEDIGIDEDAALALVEGLGGGLGGQQNLCGAVSAMSCIVSKMASDAGMDRAGVYAKVREACEMFEGRQGSLSCIEIMRGEKPYPLCCPGPVEAAALCIEAMEF